MSIHTYIDRKGTPRPRKGKERERKEKPLDQMPHTRRVIGMRRKLLRDDGGDLDLAGGMLAGFLAAGAVGAGEGLHGVVGGGDGGRRLEVVGQVVSAAAARGVVALGVVVVGVVVAATGGEEARQEARDEGARAGETGADDGDVAFHGGPGGCAGVVVYLVVSA